MEVTKVYHYGEVNANTINSLFEFEVSCKSDNDEYFTVEGKLELDAEFTEGEPDLGTVDSYQLNGVNYWNFTIFNESSEKTSLPAEWINEIKHEIEDYFDELTQEI